MASVSLADATTIRDNLVTALKALSDDEVSTYSLGSRQVTKKDIAGLRGELVFWEKYVLRKDSSTKLRGRTRPDFRTLE